MMTTVEKLPGCRAKLRIELPPDRVKAERQKVLTEFQRHARLPGYRPGKAPLRMVEARFASEIQEETINHLLRDSLREAIREKSLEILEVTGDPKTELDSVGALHIEATAILEPEFDIPDYSSIEIELAKRPVDESRVEDFVNSLREPYATFEPVEGRPAQMGDYAVATYSATLDGQALSAAQPEAPTQLCGGVNAWIFLAENSLLPGFAEAIVGMEPGHRKSVPLSVPADFAVAGLAGKTLHYDIELHSLNHRQLPPLDDALAQKIQPELTAETLRDWARQRLQNAADYEFESRKRNLAIRQLLDKTNFELPQSEVQRETRSVLLDIIRENQMRGVSDEELRKHQDELVGLAEQNARDRVRARFLLLRIARKEKFEVTETELTQLILQIAHDNEIPVKKLVADLRKRGGFSDLSEQILRRKALDLLASRVSVKAPSNPPTE